MSIEETWREKLIREAVEERKAALAEKKRQDAEVRAHNAAQVAKYAAELAERQRIIDSITAHRLAEELRLAKAKVRTWAGWKPPRITNRPGLERKWSYGGVPHNRFAPQ